ncbi:MAG TPA: SRPBCC family protein [Pirellulaceae bacterium]|nr:SRPBCC family protein [Pirellulaceae bacterium]
MAKSFILEREQLIRRPLADVFPFFADAANLQAITPEFLDFRFVTPLPIEMRAGTLIDYQIRLCGVPLKWRTRIEEFDPPHRFVDVQVRGPYKSWHHTHEFHEADGGTLMLDHVRYELPLGPLGSLAAALFVRRLLNNIFDHRRRTIDSRMSPRTG